MATNILPQFSLYPSATTSVDPLLFIIPGVVIVLLLVMIGVVVYWKHASETAIKDDNAMIRRMTADMRELDQIASAFSPEDPEPFGPLAQELEDQRYAIKEAYESIHGHYGDQRGRLAKYSHWDLSSFIQAPLIWFDIWRQSRALSQEVDDLYEMITAGQETRDIIQGQGWATANAVRQIQDEMRKIHELIQQMRRLNFQGEAFDEADRQKNQLLVRFEEIPGYFLDADESILQQQADKESIAQVFHILTENRNLVTNLSTQLFDWEGLYRNSKTALTELHRHGAELQQALTSFPAEVIVDDISGETSFLLETATQLSAHFSHPDVDHMTSFHREITKHDHSMRELIDQIAQIKGRWKGFKERTIALNNEMVVFQDKLQKLARNEQLPVDWEYSYGTFMDQAKQFSLTSATGRNRSPEELEKDLDSLSKIENEFTQLSNNVKQIDDARNQLIETLDNLNLEDSINWIQETKILYEKAALFGPENWSRRISFARFGDQVQAISTDLTDLSVGLNTLPIRESVFPFLLDEARRANENLYQIQAGEKIIRQRYEELTHDEDEARRIVENSLMALNQLEKLSKANQILEGIALKQTAASISEGNQFMSALDNRQQGTIAKKLSQIQGWSRVVEKNANQWTRSLEQDLFTRQQTLIHQVDQLKTIASLDEPVLANAVRELSNSSDLAAENGQNGRKLSYPMTDIPLRVKLANDSWQKIMAHSSALSEIEGPILDAAQQANAQRDLLINALNAAQTAINGNNGWPPVSLSLDDELNEFDNLENQWDTLQTTPQRAITLVSKLVDLAHRYENLSLHVQTQADQVSSDQQRIYSLERQIEESDETWRATLTRYTRQDPAYLQIQRMLTDAANELYQIRQCAAHNTLSYQEILQDLILLSRKLNTNQIDLDEDTSMDYEDELLVSEQEELD